MESPLPTVCALAWQLPHTIRRLSSSKALGLLLLHRCSHNFVGTNQRSIVVMLVLAGAAGTVHTQSPEQRAPPATPTSFSR